MAAAEEPKLIIDTDWKSQAQAEKERLAQKSAAAKPAAPAAAATPGAPTAAPGAAPAPGETDIPEDVGIQDVIGLIASGALTYMGFYPDPNTGQAVISLPYAKLHIDMLAALEEKTKGNLSDQESTALSNTLNRLRLEFVEMTKVVEKAVKEGRIKPQGQGGAPGIVTPGGGPGGPTIVKP